MELLAQSDRFVEPLCPYFDDCGGCKTQHVPYDQQVAAKQSSVERLLHPIPTASVNHAKYLFHYRNKTEFTVSSGRWRTKHDKKDLNESHAFTIGFFPKSTGTSRKWDGRVVSIHSCMLQDNIANRILQAVTTVVESLGDQIAAYDHLRHEGELRNLMVRVGTASNGSKEVMIGFNTATLSSGIGLLILPALLAALSPDDAALVKSIVQYVDPEMQRRHRQTESLRVLHGTSYIHDTILNSTFRVSLHSFFQPNTAMASVLYAHLVEFVATYSPTPPVVWDLFCGVGSIGICLAPHARHVVGIEIAPEAVVDAAQNAADNGVHDKTTYVCADVLKAESQDLLASLPHPDIVVVDPPRPGLSKPLISYLCDVIQPRAIVYVSCNPSTQARDLQEMLVKYDVNGSQPVDMLPHTPHVENIVYLERRQTSS
ncbi:hypothetical protein DYB32_001295 [Aphanomyces invadans]|uniref:23S rRNA (Uracil-5-)-methyltransferase RumA n=1 Tax=Aphanomyces invadans TaxID=157072 RepID=A0A3R6W3G1_9STRA|nr:hypothetical protein DYB32_001295 [Aphanomyces invadans]